MGERRLQRVLWSAAVLVLALGATLAALALRAAEPADESKDFSESRALGSIYASQALARFRAR